jgi:hypothetical protein
VGLGEGVARLYDRLDHFARRERAAPRERLREVFAVEQLHDHVRRAIFETPHIEDTRDVVALQRRGECRACL